MSVALVSYVVRRMSDIKITSAVVTARRFVLPVGYARVDVNWPMIYETSPALVMFTVTVLVGMHVQMNFAVPCLAERNAS
jgi:hypothetical protein